VCPCLPGGGDVKGLEFSFRDAASVAGIVKKAKSILAVPNHYFSGESCLTVTNFYEAYVEFAFQRGWVALPKSKFGPLIYDAIVRKFAITQRDDIKDPNAKDQQGWKGITLKSV
jgi:hypothetical protein